MKKFSALLLVLLAVFLAFSCASTGSGAVEDVPYTPEEANKDLDKIYDTYRGSLDMTGAQDYTVVKGDTLSQITRKYYGNLTSVGEAGDHNGFYFPVIMLASDSHIADPDLIEPNMKLKIVDLKRNLDNPSSRKAIKDCLNEVAVVYNKKDKPAEEAGLKKLANSL
jgi:hypothetical protein